MLKYLIACSAAALAASGVHAQAADNKAELFGQRASLQDVDISPDGQSIVYVAPGPGRQTVAYIAPLEGGTPQPILSSDANPQMLSWRSFVTNRSEEHTSELQSLMRISYAVFRFTK